MINDCEFLEANVDSVVRALSDPTLPRAEAVLLLGAIPSADLFTVFYTLLGVDDEQNDTALGWIAQEIDLRAPRRGSMNARVREIVARYAKPTGQPS